MKTRSIVAIAAVLGILTMAGMAFAGSYGHMGGGYHSGMGAGMGQGMEGYDALTPEKQELYTKIVAEADKKMTPLNEKMFAKRAELNALYNNPESDPATVGKVAGELAKMHTQMRDMHRELSLRLEKEVGIQSMGRGYRMGGHHRGRMMGCPY